MKKFNIPDRLKLDNKGQALVEFAIVCPIFLLLITLIFAAGQLCLGKMACASAAQTGCREAILYSDMDVAQEKADEKTMIAMERGLKLSFIESELSKTTEDGYSYYTYTVTFSSEGLMTFDGISGNGTFTSSVTMMTEYR